MSANSDKSNEINWQTLNEKAQQVCDNAYAPYSQFKVGAALISDDGRLFTGCNVENASYGLTICAERNCIASAVAHGVSKVKALVVFTPQEKLTTPCGACRQVMAEFMAADAIVSLVNHLGDNKQWRVSDLLPAAFTPDSLSDTAHKQSTDLSQKK